MIQPAQTARQLLLAVKKQRPTLALRQQLAALSLSYLQQELSEDNLRMAFWLNVYNAYFQLLRKEQALCYPDIYRKRVIVLAGEAFSLDDIEHGILRRYQYRRPPEQFSAVFKPELIRSLMVERVDQRMHFALNCGAVSCPPIAFYHAEKLEGQLTQATQSFLEAETTVDPYVKTVTTTALLDWYADDFGKEVGVRQLLSSILEMNLEKYAIHYKDYSWAEALHNFTGLQPKVNVLT